MNKIFALETKQLELGLNVYCQSYRSVDLRDKEKGLFFFFFLISNITSLNKEINTGNEST